MQKHFLWLNSPRVLPVGNSVAMAQTNLNRLSKEKSPYLLQHASNPVDWYPWGREAFEKARKEEKVIFLSIGYSTCHWCHVMEHESFENEDVARLLNEHFVPIKVDREERPDIDQIYMTAVQAMTGGGGWPLSIFLTPDLKPFMGGTYFPLEDGWGRVGFKTLLSRVAGIWKTQRSEIQGSGEKMAKLLQGLNEPVSELPGKEIFEQAFEQYSSRFDPVHAGFGDAPKFPSSHNLSFLLWYWKRSGNAEALEMVERTLEAMSRGGIYDHLGGGFHRYSTDREWLAPHFEKMLYDQALLAKTYAEAYQATGRDVYAQIAKEIFQYVISEMTSPEGAFYSAEDADSEGEEGRFYVWTPGEIGAHLEPQALKLVNTYYGVSAEGNFEHSSSILHTTQPLETVASQLGLNPGQARAMLEQSRVKLFQARVRRIRPYRDDKVLTAWNGLMISALAFGAFVMDEPAYADRAKQAARFILKQMRDDRGRLLRRYREGEAAIEGFQDDYAFMATGLLDLYEASGEPPWLSEAKKMTDLMIELFWDKERGGFFYTASGSGNIARMKEYYDGAIPSGNSRSALLLLRLARIFPEAGYAKKAEALILSNAADLIHHPTAFPETLMALDLFYGPAYEIVLSGIRSSNAWTSFLHSLRKTFIPYRVLLFNFPEASEEIQGLVSFLQKQRPSETMTAYVCRNFSCDFPVTSLSDWDKRLKTL